jgi:hypothetical protein
MWPPLLRGHLGGRTGGLSNERERVAHRIGHLVWIVKGDVVGEHGDVELVDVASDGDVHAGGA